MIEDYAISSKALYDVLKKKNVEFLYHANTVLTSLSFIKEKALLSRHEVEAGGLKQSFQKSDLEDKKHDVWDHVFVDGTDHHVKYSRPNFYGPVLFRLRLELLTSPLFPTVYIMRSNPLYWSDKTSLENKFYKLIEEVNEDYLTSRKLDSQIMFTFRKPQRNIKLNKFLHSIGIDEPKVLVNLKSGGNMLAGDYVRNVISKSLKENGLSHIPLLKRYEKSSGWCNCNIAYTYLYNVDYSEFKRRFNSLE